MRKVMVATAVLALASVSFAGNLLQNAGFEVPPLNWWWLTNGWTTTSATSYTGLNSATCVGSAFLHQGNWAGFSTNEISSVSLAIKNDDALSNDIYLGYFAPVGPQFTKVTYVAPDSNWHMVDLTSFMLPDIDLAYIEIHGYSNGQTNRTYVDDVTVNAVPEPLSTSLLGLGFIALLRKRSR